MFLFLLQENENLLLYFPSVHVFKDETDSEFN
jgi:hypothetical protein